jgi:predicted methyltransferase
VSIDFRECLYALSDVIINRPSPLRVFDQIHMKLPDMLLQAEAASRWFDGRSVLFIGDGDAIGLSMAHLCSNDLLPGKPGHIKVLDFDERVVNSINQFASRLGIAKAISADLYNVADPLPEEYWQEYGAFYTNPPWGASNEGESVISFIDRGVEGLGADGLACVVIGDHRGHPWTHQIQLVVQKHFIDRGFRIAEMLPEFHRYHLDDSPELTSCALLFEGVSIPMLPYGSAALPSERLDNFYGRGAPLKVKYVRDLTNGGKLVTRDVSLEPLHPERR